MGKVLLCVGEYAEVPYYVESIGLRLYSMEELCYYLTENAFLLDRELINRELVDWIDEQCGCKELGRTLYGFLNMQASVSVFVGTILEYVGYVSKQEIDKIQEYLKANAGLSGMEKKKAHADYLVANARYAQAQKEYKEIKMHLPAEETELYAKICHNEGVAFAGIMHYKEASECFLEAYQKTASQKSLESYLSALRMAHSEQDYVSLVADMPEMKDAVLRVESKFNASEVQFGASRESIRINQIQAKRKTGHVDAYEKDMEKEIQQIKDYYRMKN